MAWLGAGASGRVGSFLAFPLGSTVSVVECAGLCAFRGALPKIKIKIDMEQLNVFDCSNVLIASFFTDDQGCAHENREHTLIYLCSGELEIEERGKINGAASG